MGVDIERKREVAPSLPRRIMSGSEYELYKSSSDPENYLFDIWTLKESYGKYTGLGFKGASADTRFRIEGNAVSSGTGCNFSLFSNVRGCRGAVCSKSPDPPASALIVPFETLARF